MIVVLSPTYETNGELDKSGAAWNQVRAVNLDQIGMAEANLNTKGQLSVYVSFVGNFARPQAFHGKQAQELMDYLGMPTLEVPRASR